MHILTFPATLWSLNHFGVAGSYRYLSYHCWLMVTFLNAADKCFSWISIAFALAVPCWKIYETSYAFREAEDPSKYDNVVNWFETKKPYMTHMVGGGKQSMRVYTFVLPFVASAFFALLAVLARAKGRSTPRAGAPGPAPAPVRRPPSGHSAGNKLRAILFKQIFFPSFMSHLGFPRSLTRDEVLGVTVFLVLNLLVLSERVSRSLARGAEKLEFLMVEDDSDPIPNLSFQAVEIWAKSLSVVAILNMGWYLMMPIGRRSVLLEIMGVSWEYAIKWHRWVGAYTTFLIVVHSVMYLIVWVHGNGHHKYDPDGVMLKHNLVAGSCDGEANCGEDQRLMLRRNIYGIFALFSLLVIAGTSTGFVRRRYFELFYYAHHLFVVLLAFTCMHYSGAMIYLIPGLATYLVDKVCRLAACRGEVVAEVELVTEDLLEVRVPVGAGGGGYRAGQYVFLCVPAVFALQWHPFSLTSAPYHPDACGVVVFHIKALGGDASWTTAVLAAARGAAGGRMRVKVDGFYGHAAAEKLVPGNTGAGGARKGVLLVGGGVGVTPLLSILTDVCARTDAPVALLWCTRTVAEFLALAPRIACARARYGARLQVNVAITRAPTAKSQPHHAMLIGQAKMKPRWPLAAQNTPNTAAGFGGAFEPVASSVPMYAFACLVSILALLGFYAEIKSREDAFPHEDNVRFATFIIPVVAAALVILVLLAGDGARRSA